MDNAPQEARQPEGKEEEAQEDAPPTKAAKAQMTRTELFLAGMMVGTFINLIAVFVGRWIGDW